MELAEVRALLIGRLVHLVGIEGLAIRVGRRRHAVRPEPEGVIQILVRLTHVARQALGRGVVARLVEDDPQGRRISGRSPRRAT